MASYKYIILDLTYVFGVTWECRNRLETCAKLQSNIMVLVRNDDVSEKNN